MKKLIISALCLAFLVSCTFSGNKSLQQTGEESGLYQEKYRPQIHFSPPANWMNDPNGMVFYNDEYHLFYQYYPEKSVWGPMHWGHAISKDLIHWENQPVALYPDSLGYIFSGSAVADLNNTSGFGSLENPPLVAFFTYHDPEAAKNGLTEVESQALAYSTDQGRTWTKYADNPVVANPGIRDFRDPKVFWHEDSQKWIMSLAAGQEIIYYASPDCISWEYLSRFGNGYGNHEGVWECPDLLEFTVDDSDEKKWVQIVNINPGGPYGGSATQYFVGDFDGKTFTSDQRDTLWMDHGRDNYAGVTWSNAPDDKKILIGWMNNWQYAGEKPCLIWSGAATFPRELGLVKDGNLYLLTSKPVEALAGLYGEQIETGPLQINQNTLLSDQFSFAKSPVEILLNFDFVNAEMTETKAIVPSDTKQTTTSDAKLLQIAEQFGIRLKNDSGEYLEIGYNRLTNDFYIDRTNASGELFSDQFASVHSIPNPESSCPANWQLLIDNSSVEFFTADGRVAATTLFYPSEPFEVIELFAVGGELQLNNIQINELNSIWK